MKKIMGLLFAFVFIFIIIFSKPSFNVIADENDLNELWGEATKDYLEKDYSEYCNKQLIGKYYKVGVMGHRIVTEIKDVKLVAYRIEDFIPSQSVGLSKETKLTRTTTYKIIKKVTASQQVSIGACEIISAVVDLKDIASVGNKATLTTEYNFTIEKCFSEELLKSIVIEDVLDYTTIPEDKKTFSVSRVACFLEFDISSTYTQEQNMFGHWGKLGSTEKNNVIMRYYIADVVCYCYNDNTFGDTKMGVYPLTIMKEY